MKRFQNLIQHFFPPALPLAAGIYHFQSPPDAPAPLRLHLRVEPGGLGILIINAHTVLHLNQTAVEYVYHLIHQTPEIEVGSLISRRYHISKEQAILDFRNLRDRIDTLINTPDLDPTTFLDMDRTALYSSEFSAPYRLDCAVTYRLQEDAPNLAPVERVKQELTLDSWKIILGKAWKAGIPHVIFTGGEATLREDLLELIKFAEQQGMVTGLLTNGLRLAEPVYLKSILQTGLDHLMIILDPDNEVCWKAIRDVIAEDISLCVHLTITGENVHRFPEILNQLTNLNLRQLSLSVMHLDLKDALRSAQQQAIVAGFNMVWDLPVPYSKFNPVAFELEGLEEIPQGAGKAWLYVEPDGDILCGQGLEEVLGNLLNDSWEKIWNNRPKSAC